MNAAGAAWVTAYAAIGQVLAAVVLAVLTAVYVRQNRSIVASVALQAREQQRTARAALLSEILAEYGSPEMGSAIREVRAWCEGVGYNIAADQFERALRTREHSHAVEIDHGSRRRLSQYFSRVRVLADAELLEPYLIAAGLGREPIDFLLTVVDPLDQAARRARGLQESNKTRVFFEHLRHDQLFQE